MLTSSVHSGSPIICAICTRKNKNQLRLETKSTCDKEKDVCRIDREAEIVFTDMLYVLILDQRALQKEVPAISMQVAITPCYIIASVCRADRSNVTTRALSVSKCPRR